MSPLVLVLASLLVGSPTGPPNAASQTHTDAHADVSSPSGADTVALTSADATDAPPAVAAPGDTDLTQASDTHAEATRTQATPDAQDEAQADITPPPADARAVEAPSASAVEGSRNPTVSINQSGLRVTDANNRFYVGLRGYGQIAYTQHFNDPGQELHSGFSLASLRPTLLLGMGDLIELRIQLNITSSGARAHDAFMTIRAHDILSFRLGQQRPLLNIERSQSSTDTLFASGSLVNAFSPTRHIGLVADLQPLDGLHIELGVFNAGDDGEVPTRLREDHPDLQARVRVAPLAFLRDHDGAQLTLGGAINTGVIRGSTQEPRVPARRGPAGRVYATLPADLYADGARLRATGFAYLEHRGLFLMAEYIHARVNLSDGIGHTQLHQHAWHAAASYAFGGDNTVTGVKPTQSFFDGGYGAIQLKARVHQARILGNDGADSGSSRVGPWVERATPTGVSAGLAWWLSSGLRIQTDYHWMTFDTEDATPVRDEHILQGVITLAL